MTTLEYLSATADSRHSMQIIETIEAMHKARRTMTGSVGVVLTMGALHEGHLSLVREARAENDFVIATIFVNPLQFAAHEDLNKYPRDLPGDLAMLEAAGVDLVFTPTPVVMYPDGFQTSVLIKQVTQGLEGERRPGHFEGVATVVAKLFNLTQPTRAYFGQKDAQQVAVIKRLVRDLNFSLDVVVFPTVREANGLAMSSRNRYLSPDQRAKAASIWHGLQAAGAAYHQGERTPSGLKSAVSSALDKSMVIEYIAVNTPDTLTEIQSSVEHPLLLSLAVRLGDTRLIDNVLLPLELNTREHLTHLLGG